MEGARKTRGIIARQFETDNPCNHTSVTVLFYVMNSHFSQLHVARGLSPPAPPPHPLPWAGGRVQSPRFQTARCSGGQQGSLSGPGELEPSSGAECLSPGSLGRKGAQGHQLGPGARAGPVQSAEVACSDGVQCPRVPLKTAGRACCHMVPSPELPVVRVAETFLPAGARGPGLGSPEPGSYVGLPE